MQRHLTRDRANTDRANKVRGGARDAPLLPCHRGCRGAAATAAPPSNRDTLTRCTGNKGDQSSYLHRRRVNKKTEEGSRSLLLVNGCGRCAAHQCRTELAMSTCVDSAGRSVSRGRDCRRGPVPFLSKQASISKQATCPPNINCAQNRIIFRP